MSSLNNILNPESSYESTLRLQAVRSPSSSTTSPTEKLPEPSKPVEIRPPPPPRTEVIIRAHEPHPDCPDTLACLPDTDGRPQHTLPVILRCTILGSPRKRLTIREIYAAMERKYPYYKTAGPAWKQSVRHHLSLNRLFERQPRPPSDPGFGSYWTVNLDAPPGTKRPRKRGGRTNKMDGPESGTITVLGPSSPPPPIPLGQRTLPALPGPPAPSMPAASSSQAQSQPPQPPPSATPSSASSIASAPSNTPSTSSTATSASVRPFPLSPQSPKHSPEDHPQTHPGSPRSPRPHMHPPAHMQPTPLLRQHPHSLVSSQPPHHPIAQPPQHAHPHPAAQGHLQSGPHVHPHPPLSSHSKPPSHNHAHPPPPAHHQVQAHPHPSMHPALPSPHNHVLQPPPQASPHSHPHQQPYPHPPPHGPPSAGPPTHSNSSHSHPHSHNHAHAQRSPVNANNHSQGSVSTIATLRPVDSRSFNHTSTLRRGIYDDDDDDDEMDWEDDGAGGPYSEDDYSSSEDMPYQYDPRHHNHGSSSYAGPSHRSYSASQAQPGRSVLHGAFSGFSSVDHPEATIDRLKMEMAGLRRQSQDAINASLRLSDELRATTEELARVKEEATRAKSALKIAENMLEEETRRRLQAEKTIEEERMRRAADDTLRQYQAQAQVQRKSTGYTARS